MPPHPAADLFRARDHVALVDTVVMRVVDGLMIGDGLRDLLKV